MKRRNRFATHALIEVVDEMFLLEILTDKWLRETTNRFFLRYHESLLPKIANNLQSSFQTTHHSALHFIMKTVARVKNHFCFDGAARHKQKANGTGKTCGVMLVVPLAACRRVRAGGVLPRALGLVSWAEQTMVLCMAKC